MNNLIIYKEKRELIQTGDVIQWQGKSLMSRMIMKFSEYSHSSLVIRFREYDHERVFVLEAVGKGIDLVYLSEKLEKYNGKAFWQKLNASFAERKKVGKFALSAKGKSIKYDYYSLIKNICGRVNMNAKRFFCSEFVYASYAAVGILKNILDKAPRPGDLKKLDILEDPVRLI